MVRNFSDHLMWILRTLAVCHQSVSFEAMLSIFPPWFKTISSFPPLCKTIKRNLGHLFCLDFDFANFKSRFICPTQGIPLVPTWTMEGIVL